MQQCQTLVIGVPGREERECGRGNIERDNSWEFSVSDERHEIQIVQ